MEQKQSFVLKSADIFKKKASLGITLLYFDKCDKILKYQCQTCLILYFLPVELLILSPKFSDSLPLVLTHIFTANRRNHNKTYSVIRRKVKGKLDSG